MRVCAREDCRSPFQANKHNQRYCSVECCKVVTNQRIMAAYYEEKARKSGKTRICSSCNITKLSRYNPSKICQACIASKKTDERQALLALVN